MGKFLACMLFVLYLTPDIYAAITADQKYLLNKWGHVARKTQLGTLIDNADTVTIDEIPIADGKIVVGNGSGAGAAVDLSGDATIANTGAITIAAGAVEETMLAVPTADGLQARRVARATYDFAEHAGAQGAIGLGVTLPDNAVAVRAWYEVLTTLESSGDLATIAISAEGANDIVTATAINAGGDVWDAGFHEAIQDGTIAAAIKTSAAKEITATIAVEDVTAGKFIVFVEYVVSD